MFLVFSSIYVLIFAAIDADGMAYAFIDSPSLNDDSWDVGFNREVFFIGAMDPTRFESSLESRTLADMRWKRSPPTKPGFYYWQGGNLTGLQVAVVQVTAFKDASRPLEARELKTSENYTNAPKTGPASSWGGRWAGPLPQPE